MSPLDHQADEAFDTAGPLPEGVTLLEASAGTGKTYAIAALAARYIADGAPIEDLLLVTFGRMATGELRERVRERLVSVEAALSAFLAGEEVETDDEVAKLLASGDTETVLVHRNRLADAISNFDAATIATIHAFCQEVLAGLGASTEVEGESEFTEDLAEMTEEVIDDLYVRRFNSEESPRMTRGKAAQIAKVAIENPDAELTAPDDPNPDGLAQMRVRLAGAARDELERRKRLAGLMTYDDLLVRLHAALHGEGGEAVAERLAARYSVVLVDEFQDTDPIQWGIFRRAFGEQGRALVLIGDPKQAIYAFRGADVYAYLEAAELADRRATLRTNWRSDAGLLDAYDALFRGARLGHDRIVYRDVEAAPRHSESGLLDAPYPAPLRIRLVSRDAGFDLTKPGLIRVPAAREHIARDLAGEVVELLSSGARIVTERDPDGSPAATEVVGPGHLAVLVPTNRNAALVRDALDEVGVKAVINGAGSVFGTEEAEEWLQLLKAIERPSSASRAHGAALSCFIGWPIERIAAADEAEWGAVHRRLHGWGRIVREKGVASLVEAMTIGERIPERLLVEPEGERRMTDLRHIGQLLHEAASADRLGVSALTAWLATRIAEAPRDTADEQRSRRLESDEEAVQVLTIHRSKGLEFPIVYAPFLWQPSFAPKSEDPVTFHDPDAGDKRRLDVSLHGKSFSAHHKQALEEDRGEDLRLAYVALTRARHQAVVWWAAADKSQHSPLERLLFARDEDDRISSSGPKTPDDAEMQRALEEVAARAPGQISVERSTDASRGSWDSGGRPQAELRVAAFDRDLDPIWRRTSYSDIASGAYELRVASEPEVGALADEPGEAELVAPIDPPTADRSAVPSLMSSLPTGVKLGTFVHEAFERIDFAAADLPGEVKARVAEGLMRSRADVGDPEVLATALEAVIETPLGPDLDDHALRDFAAADRLDELRFELPLAGGDDPTGSLRLDGIAEVLREHLPADDPLAGYADALGEPGLRKNVRGYLNGSLDLVARLAADGGRPRFAIFDYKTNWLAARGEELTSWHHRPEALRREMRRGQYGLQAILYLATLHRYLRWRLPDYDPETNLAGVYYLFIRGMSGSETPMIDGERCGVLAWRPPGAAIEALSDVLDGVAV